MIPRTPDNSTLVLRRVFAASRERVFRAWIEPEALERWFRPKGLGITVRALDARVGGSFRFEVENGHAIVGTYLRVVSPEQLVFTYSGDAIHGRETVVTLDFLDQGPVTEVVLTHEGLSADLWAVFAGGWPLVLDALASALSSPSQS
ncbi:MAG TPA: SRPBCC domain-containing protein [Ktedonobacterales bacterium]|nr:SRPBCC domain-containing protein [Ktedonobacterales bacterium]